MLAALLVFLLVTGLIVGGYFAVTMLPDWLRRRQLDRRLREISRPVEADGASVLAAQAVGPLPAVERLVARTGTGAGLTRLIDQSGVRTTPSAVLMMGLVAAAAAALLTEAFVRQPFLPLVAAVAGLAAPFAWLLQRRAARLRQFEEQFPEALDLLSRAIRAGHAFQTALGMVADELPPPVGVEFRKTFDQQNFGLPLNEALTQMADRVSLLDVRFFATAVAIQRETGGNLAEILDNLAHVVRERFKILRQVRVYTAHGRFTVYVLLALPAALGVALTYLNPGQMNALFEERLGHMLLAGAIVLQFIGFVWIRQVIKIEV